MWPTLCGLLPRSIIPPSTFLHSHFRGPRGGGGGGFGGDKPGVASHYSRKEEDLETLWKNNSTTGINFSKYDRIPVHVEGDGKPRQVIRIVSYRITLCIFFMLNNHHHRPLNTFDEAGFAPLLASNIRRATYKVPTPVQKYGIPIVKVNYCILILRAVALHFFLSL